MDSTICSLVSPLSNSRDPAELRALLLKAGTPGGGRRSPDDEDRFDLNDLLVEVARGIEDDRLWYGSAPFVCGDLIEYGSTDWNGLGVVDGGRGTVDGCSLTNYCFNQHYERWRKSGEWALNPRDLH